MLTEEGRVVAVEAQALWVETIRQSTCGSCAAQKACGHALINKVSDGTRGLVRVLPGDQGLAGCRVDDRVRFSIPEEVILRGSAIAYMLPLAGMLGGAFAAVSLFSGDQDTLAALGAIAGLAAGFGLVRWHAVRHRSDPKFQPVQLQNLGRAGAPAPLL